MTPKRLVVGISGSSGVILGIRLLQALQDSEMETHLIVTSAARLTIEQETDWKVEDVLALAHVQYNPRDIGAAIASGSFATLGMVVIPCSIKSLSAVANSYSTDLLARAADVTLKEGRPLLLVVRETPAAPRPYSPDGPGRRSRGDHFSAGAGLLHPPAERGRMVDNLVGRVLARLGIENHLYAALAGSARCNPAGR